MESPSEIIFGDSHILGALSHSDLSLNDLAFVTIKMKMIDASAPKERSQNSILTTLIGHFRIN